jgi:hypothetical protein
MHQKFLIKVPEQNALREVGKSAIGKEQLNAQKATSVQEN